MTFSSDSKPKVKLNTNLRTLEGSGVLFFIKRSDWTMEKIFYGSLGIALCITGIWGIIREFIPEKYRLFKKGRKEK